jgi:hypothetical protein
MATTPLDRLNEAIANQGNQFAGRHGIILHFAGPAVYVQGRTQGYRLYVTIKRATNMSPAIFVYQRMPEGNNQFTNIASPNDLVEYPLDQPATEPGSPPFLRLDHADLVFRNLDLLVDAALTMITDVCELVRSLNYMDSLANLGDVEIGHVVESSSSSSSSSTPSSSPSPSSGSSGSP